MLAKLFEVKDTNTNGKGLYAKCFIPKGTITFFECQKCRNVSTEEFKSMLTTVERNDVMMYGYRKADGSYLLPCDEIIYLNHSCNANILDSGMGFDVTVEDIKRGDEATYDYRFFHDPDELEFKCLCGKVNCCKVVRCIHPAPTELSEYWRKRIDSALFSIQ
jgi:hypothetical protein